MGDSFRACLAARKILVVLYDALHRHPSSAPCRRRPLRGRCVSRVGRAGSLRGGIWTVGVARQPSPARPGAHFRRWPQRRHARNPRHPGAIPRPRHVLSSRRQCRPPAGSGARRSRSPATPSATTATRTRCSVSARPHSSKPTCGARSRPSRPIPACRTRVVSRALRRRAGSAWAGRSAASRLPASMWSAIGRDWRLNSDNVFRPPGRRAPRMALSCVYTMGANCGPIPISASRWKPCGAWSPRCWNEATNWRP